MGSEPVVEVAPEAAAGLVAAWAPPTWLLPPGELVGVVEGATVGGSVVEAVGSSAEAVSTHEPEWYESHPHSAHAGAAEPVVCHTSSTPSRRVLDDLVVAIAVPVADHGAAEGPPAGELGPARRRRPVAAKAEIV